MAIRNLDPDDDYAYDRTNQSASNPGWNIQVDTKSSYPLTQWAVYRGHLRVEGGFADREAARVALARLRSRQTA